MSEFTLEKAPVLGSYAITQELQRDGFGILYRATQPDSDEAALVRVISSKISSSENFIVRFELLKTLLPNIVHKNLLRVLQLGNDGNVFYIAKEWPSEDADKPLLTLNDFDPRDTHNRHRTWESLFDGIARGLHALEQVRDDYHKSGIIHENLDPSHIYLDFEKSLVGTNLRPIPKIDGYAEAFLFFGDTPDARLRYRMAEPLYQWSQDTGAPQLFTRESLYPHSSRNGGDANNAWMLHQLGALIHQSIGGNQVKGEFPALAESDPTLDPLWDMIADLCLSAIHRDENSSMESVIDLFNEMAKKRSQLSTKDRKLRKVTIPDDMALVAIQEKVILGAEDGAPVETPAFKAKLRPFLIDTAPITVEQFGAFLHDYEPSCYARQQDVPATMVSWHAALAYCRWRSEQEGLPPDSYRLPTEYEWEAAVRGSSGQQYPWGDQFIEERVHCGLPPEHGAFPVRETPPGRFGLYDMLGNVWEWTQSNFKPHPFYQGDTKLFNPHLYIVKGGCWYTPKKNIRASLRAAFAPTEQRGNIGFRCVREVQLEETDDGDQEAGPESSS